MEGVCASTGIDFVEFCLSENGMSGTPSPTGRIVLHSRIGNFTVSEFRIPNSELLHDSLVEHCLCNSLEACDVCACNKVIAETVFLCTFSGNVVDVLHNVVKLAVNLFC